MIDLEEYVLSFDGFAARTSTTHLVIDRDGYVAFGELADNPGTSVTNALELACASVAKHFFSGSPKFEVFEWFPHDLRTQGPALYAIAWHADGFRLPEWVAPADTCLVRALRKRVDMPGPYTADALHKRGIPDLRVTGAREELARLRERLPPTPVLPDRRPGPRPEAR
jgi:hypothetical protein